MSRAGFASLAIAVLACGCHRSPARAPPRGWRSQLDVAQLAPACVSMIGKRFPTRPSTEPRAPRGATEIDVASSAIPAAIRALHPVAIEVDGTSAELVLGRYRPPGAADDELDHYGLVCTTGAIPTRFQTPSGTFLKPLGPSLWAYDGVL